MSFLTTRGKVPPQPDPLPVPEKRFSDKAIQFGQHIAELEDENALLREQLSEMTQRAKFAETKLNDLTGEKAELKRDRDEWQERWIRTQTELETAGSIILNAIKKKPEDRFRPRPEAIRAVEKALATKAALEDPDAAKPLPNFLKSQSHEDKESPERD